MSNTDEIIELLEDSVTELCKLSGKPEEAICTCITTNALLLGKLLRNVEDACKSK